MDHRQAWGPESKALERLCSEAALLLVMMLRAVEKSPQTRVKDSFMEDAVRKFVENCPLEILFR